MSEHDQDDPWVAMKLGTRGEFADFVQGLLEEYRGARDAGPDYEWPNFTLEDFLAGLATEARRGPDPWSVSETSWSVFGRMLVAASARK